MPDYLSASTLVLGVGNQLLSDEGVGVHVVMRLIEKYEIPIEEVLVLDGGTLGMDLLYYLEGKDNLLIIDAVQAGIDPGGRIRLEGDEVPAFLSVKISPHQIGVPDMLIAAKLKDIYPQNVVLLGIQPESLDVSLDLSSTVASQVDGIVIDIVDELASWGHTVQPR